ncbi:MAG: pimeloyl-ACP methyl ester esterase BioH [Gammaproteobacteria bacterium]|nr:pimeloyl-ACP methyl ester esterase BioH [Gammaproteobacteria bacterium]
MSDSGLYVERRGSGPALVLIHGWGLHSGIWQSTAESLAQDYEVYSVDLPGHGRSALSEGQYSLQQLATEVSAAVPANSNWIGWSLGGLVAQAAASSGAKIKRLILVGATPRFKQAEDWPHAMTAEVLQGFSEELANDYRATLNRFLAIQSMGSSSARDELKVLRRQLFTHGEPALEALNAGLKILSETDMRAVLAGIPQLTLWLHGERDMLAPVAAAEAAVAMMTDAQLLKIKGAGHAPFLSHPDEFMKGLKAFLDG